MDMGVKAKLLIALIAATLITLALTGWWGSRGAAEALKDQSAKQLVTVRETKTKAVRTYFDEVANDLFSLAENPALKTPMRLLTGAYDSFVSANGLQPDKIASMRRQLSSHFDSIFSSEYIKRNDGSRPAPYLGQLSDSAVALQYFFKLNKQNSSIQENDLSPYDTLHQQLSAFLPAFANRNGYRDILLVSTADSQVVYSVAKNADYATSLAKGPFAHTNLGTVFREASALNDAKVVWADLSLYQPCYNQPCFFVATPVLQENKAIGVIIFEISPSALQTIMDDHSGLGSSGESFLIGPDFLPRTTTRHDPEHRSITSALLHPELASINTRAARLALQGKSGLITAPNYAGRTTLTSYGPLEAAGRRWAMLVEINESELLAPIANLQISLALVGCVIALLMACFAIWGAHTIATPLRQGADFAKAIAEGELERTLDIVQQDELGELAKALNDMAQKLKDQHWLAEGKTGLHEKLRGGLTVNEMSRRCVAFLSKHLNCHVGVLYLAEDEEWLKLEAGYSFTDRTGTFNRIRVGEGMVGQAALESELITFRASRNAPAIHYGLGEEVPGHFLIAPFSYEETLLGVIELGSMDVFTPLKRQFILNNLENIAISFHSAQSRTRVQELLKQSRDQAEVLREQQEELQGKNSELERQTQALRTSEQTLQEQQEELRVTNEELIEQTKALKASEEASRQQQEELQAANDTLEQRSKDLEHQKEAMRNKNIELKKAQREIKQKAIELESASRYKSEFLANMSHELRTPLNSILILSQILRNNREGNLTPKQQEFAQTIHSSGSDLLSLINEVLDLSKVEAGKTTLSTEKLKLREFADNMERFFKQLIEDKGLTFEIQVDSNLPESILTDGRRVQQICNNLLNNAIKFTEEGLIKFRIRRPAPEVELFRSGLDAPRTVAFEISDTGIGVPKDKQQLIFEAFQQADGTTSRKYGGTGLGLSISKELATFLGGEIQLSSEEGKGSVFTLFLPEELQVAPPEQDQRSKNPRPQDPPLRQEHADAEEPEAAVSPASNGTFCETISREASATKRLLLIIEDDSNFSRILYNLAQEKGFKCLIAHDGETGLHMALEYAPDAVILDIGLPGMDGMAVMEKLKSNPATRHIPVHIISAIEESRHALQMGAIGYLTKPVSMENLSEAFNRLETIINRSVKRLLIVEDDPVQQKSLTELVSADDVAISTVENGEQALDLLQKEVFDCVILDLGLAGMSGFELLSNIKKHPELTQTPVIIYTGKDITPMEEAELARYAESIIIKGVRSPERLLDESALFLHRVESALPQDKQQMIRNIHDREAILEGRKILIADDDRRNRLAISHVLEEKGIQVVCVENGKDCLSTLETEPEIDLVLMDIMMPEMDGYEAMQHIRNEPGWKKLPVIALTAKAMKGDRLKCIEAGANDYLSKPVDMDKLLSLLRVWLHR